MMLKERRKSINVKEKNLHEREEIQCFHCGDICLDNLITFNDHIFCCSGCKQVFLLLNDSNLCNYYNLDKTPGIKAKGKFVSDRFAYLDDESVINQLVKFSSAKQVNVVFELPQMHCSSCIYLIENLHKLNEGIIVSTSNFQKKEVFISYNPMQVSLRQVVELLAFIGYEPNINLHSINKKKKTGYNKNQIYKIGIAGFCFSNIMMLSFPEYFSGGNIGNSALKETFTWIIFLLSLPVLLFSASDFFISAYKGLRQRFLNIDAPIALAIVVSFGRSYFEILTHTGAGYLDSATGIVFFMLIGRWFQNKTYESFSFDRDYRSYFPLGVTVLQSGVEKNIPVTQLRTTDVIIVRNEEMIPADSILLRGKANIDYSFVSGENNPVEKKKGDIIYAGGKQCGGALEMEVIKEPSQSYITQLWNNNTFHSNKNQEKSFIHPWSKYFTITLFSIAFIAMTYWLINDATKILSSVSSVLIVACPCSLLLATTFTYGNMLRICGKNKLYLKNTSVLETLAKVKEIVLDKTGTLTQNNGSIVSYVGTALTEKEAAIIKTVIGQSSHPLGKLIYTFITTKHLSNCNIQHFAEYTGKGIEAICDQINIKLGSYEFIKDYLTMPLVNDNASKVHVIMNYVHAGFFSISNQYRKGIKDEILALKKNGFGLHLLSGDNNAEYANLKSLFGEQATVNFNQTPQQKLNYIKDLQHKNNNGVLMVGDGLNDAGALKQSNVGIAVSDNTSRFTPACDAILDGGSVNQLHHFIGFAKSGKLTVSIIFAVSILYNLIGLFFAVQAKLSPMIAAVLMPLSSITIVGLSILLTALSAQLNKL